MAVRHDGGEVVGIFHSRRAFSRQLGGGNALRPYIFRTKPRQLVSMPDAEHYLLAWTGARLDMALWNSATDTEAGKWNFSDAADPTALGVSPGGRYFVCGDAAGGVTFPPRRSVH